VTGGWSIDVRVMVRPARTFRELADAPAVTGRRSSIWVAAQRPLFLTLVLASVASLIGASVATVRLMAPTAIYWSFVPAVEILALAIVTWRRRGSRGLPHVIDVFFSGHATWTLWLLIVGAAMALASPQHWWFLITRPALAGLVLVTAWSAYVDFWFFRHVCGAGAGRAIGDVALHRFIAWTLIFWVFAVPEPTPFGVFQEIVEAVLEVVQ
jgi:hypothetical protein